MAQITITTDSYQLFPSPRNAHRVVFEHEVFVPHPYALIDLASFSLQGQVQPVRRPPAGGPQDGPARDV